MGGRNVGARYDVAVAGGGLLGRLLAWRLARQGVRVLLHDKGQADGSGSAAFVAAAMLAPLAEAVDGTAVSVRLGQQSLAMWQAWLAELEQDGGRRVFFQQQGSLMVWHGQDAALAQRFRQHLQQAHGSQVWQEWGSAELAAGEAQLQGRFRQALFLPSEAQLDNRQLLDALNAALQARGVACRWGSAADWDTLHTQADWVLDCRGFGARADWNAEQLSRLRGVRGEVARVYAPDVRLNRPVRLLHPRYPLYICPKENHVFVIGATQLESEDDSPISVRSSLELFSALYTVCPAFGEARVLETASGVRPVLNHESPELRYSTVRRLLRINGLFRHGFMLAPALGDAALRVLNALQHGVAPADEVAASGLACVDLDA